MQRDKVPPDTGIQRGRRRRLMLSGFATIPALCLAASLLTVTVLSAQTTTRPGDTFDPVAAADAAWEEEMRLLAEKGDGEAMVELGRIYQEKGDRGAAEQWLRRAQDTGIQLPPDVGSPAPLQKTPGQSVSGWGTGRVERRSADAIDPAGSSSAPCQTPGFDLDRTLRRADLALSEKDLDRWLAAIVSAVRAGCRSPELTASVERARAVEDNLERSRDREIAAAVRKGRPTLGSQVGRSIDGSSSGSSNWALVASELIAVLQDRKNQRPSGDGRIPQGVDGSTQRTYAGIYADTQHLAAAGTGDDYWGDVARQVKGLQDEAPKPGDSTSAASAPPPLPPGSDFTPPPGDGCNPAPAERCAGTNLKRPGAVCTCCPGTYGLGSCLWQGGERLVLDLDLWCLYNDATSIPPCVSGTTDRTTGGWWVWRTEENWTDNTMNGDSQPRSHITYGPEKPKGCTEKRPSKKDSDFSFTRVARPFDSYAASWDYVVAQKKACCAQGNSNSRQARTFCN